MPRTAMNAANTTVVASSLAGEGEAGTGRRLSADADGNRVRLCTTKRPHAAHRAHPVRLVAGKGHDKCHSSWLLAATSGNEASSARLGPAPSGTGQRGGVATR